MRFRLRYLQHDLELNEGRFAVGRNARCQLSLDDPLVSRRHAIFEVTEAGVTIEDMASRNGVIVNGHRIEEKVTLAIGDRIVIGSQELRLLGATDSRGEGSAEGGTMTLPQVRVDPLSSSSDLPTESDVEPSMARRADQFKLLYAVAEKALAMGKAAEAERLAASALADVIEATRAGRPLPPTLVDQAAKLSAKLATATSKGGWADYVIELYAAQNRPCPAPVVDELYSAMRRVASVDLVRLRTYIASIRQNVRRYGPAERFLVQRLEGLERLASLK
ncbi:MAG: FHA domain-containing protein [Polyangiaceae bacterium]|nr:FHA domain-containing protein [Polyangiaceae bacterium]